MRLVSIGALGAFALLIGPQTAAAGSPTEVQRTDPPAGSPAGVIYQIPLDTARRDASPVLPAGSRHGGHGSGGGEGDDGSAGGAGTESGSSGAAGAAAPIGTGATHAKLVAAREAAVDGGSTPNDPSSIHSENGFGSSSEVPGVSPAATQMGAGVAAAHAAGSTFPSYLLVGVIALAAVAVGLLATRARRSGEPESTKPPTIA